MKFLSLIAGLLLLVGGSLHAQVTNAEAEAYFGQFMDRAEQAVEFKSILATKKQLKQILGRKDAKLVAAHYKEEIEAERSDPGSKEYSQVRIVNFSSEEVQAGTDKAAGGMGRIANKFKPGVYFYEVTYYKRENAKIGLSYKYFVHLKDEWVFVPKPWRAFK